MLGPFEDARVVSHSLASHCGSWVGTSAALTRGNTYTSLEPIFAHAQVSAASFLLLSRPGFRTDFSYYQSTCYYFCEHNCVGPRTSIVGGVISSLDPPLLPPAHNSCRQCGLLHVNESIWGYVAGLLLIRNCGVQLPFQCQQYLAAPFLAAIKRGSFAAQSKETRKAKKQGFIHAQTCGIGAV